MSSTKTPHSTSPNLEVISSDSADRTGALREKRRKPRIHLSSEQFRIDSLGKIFSVVDLSTDGIALRILDQRDLLALPVAMVVQGTLNLRGRKLPLQVQVRHIAPDVVGCQFFDLDSEVRTSLESFLDPSELGRELRPIPSSDQGVLWYHGPGGTDLLLSRNVDGTYRRLTLFVLGSYVQWEDDTGATTGRASPSEERADLRTEQWGAVQFETMILETDASPDPDKLSIAKALILSSNLPQDLKKWCTRQLTLPQ